jgi:hypothetical protein
VRRGYGYACSEEGRTESIVAAKAEAPVLVLAQLDAPPSAAPAGPWSPRVDSECWTAPGEKVIPVECCAGLRSVNICVVQATEHAQ